MVSNVKFYSGKDLNLRRAVPFWMTLVIVVALLLISIEPSHVLWGIMVAYGVSGYVGWVVQRWRAEGRGSLGRVLRETGGAVGLCSLTTVIGYGSLLVAQSRALRGFGTLASAGELGVQPGG